MSSSFAAFLASSFRFIFTSWIKDSSSAFSSLSSSRSLTVSTWPLTVAQIRPVHLLSSSSSKEIKFVLRIFWSWVVFPVLQY